MQTPSADILPASPRLAASRVCYWAALAAGIAVNTVELYWLVVGIRQMLGGSCNAALIGLWFGAPLIPLAPILFGTGWLLGRREDARAYRAGTIGLALALLALPLWIALGGGITALFGLG